MSKSIKEYKQIVKLLKDNFKQKAVLFTEDDKIIIYIVEDDINFGTDASIFIKASSVKNPPNITDINTLLSFNPIKIGVCISGFCYLWRKKIK